MTKHFNQDTQGWLVFYDVKGQCGDCKHVIREHKMAACDWGRHEFGNAHNCPVFRMEGE
jgi:hypothetical protein